MIKTADLTPRQKKIAIAVGVVLLIYLLFGFIGAPFIVRRILENTVAQAIDRQVSVAAVRVNPLTLSVTVRGLDIREKTGAPFIHLGETYANLQTSSLFKWALVLKTVRLDTPVIDLVRLDAQRFNFSDIGAADPAATAPPSDDAESGGLALAIYDTRITGGRITLADRVTGVDHRIDDLDLKVTDFSSRPADVDVYTLFDMSSRINGAGLSLNGKTRPFRTDRETRVELGLDALDLPHYLPYLPIPPDLQVKALTVSLDSESDFSMHPDGTPELVAAGTLGLRNLQLAHGDGTALFNQQALTVELLPSRVLAGQIRLAQVDIDGPEMFLERLSSGALRLPRAAAPAAAAPAPTPADSDASPPVITLDRLVLQSGVVHYADHANSAPFTTTITDLNLTVDNAGYNTDRTAAYRLALKTEADESVSLTGTASLTPLTATGEFSLQEIDLTRYRPFYQDRFAFKATSGKSSLGGNFRFRQDDDQSLISLAGLHLEVDALALVEATGDTPLVSLERFSVADTTADLTNGEITLGSVTLAKASLVCRREKDGTLNLVNAFVPAGPDDAVPPPATPSEPPPAEAAPVVLNVKTIAVSDLSVAVEDRVPATPVKLELDRIALNATDLSTVSGKTGQADLSMQIEKNGRLDVGGMVAIAPLSLDLAVDVKKIDLRSFQPYLSEQAGLVVTRGMMDTKGRLKLSMDAAGTPTIDYRGNADVNRFASIDRKNSNDFLKWEALRFDTLAAGVNPTRLSIDQIGLSDFFARVIVDADGSVNLVSMFASPDEKTAATGKTVPAAASTSGQAVGPSIKIDRVSLNRGIIDFSDYFIRPNYSVRFHDLGGRISGLESMADKRADVLLEGMWADHAPVKISGQINPLIENPYVDLNLNISDIELSPFSPYTGKYIGYILDKGKLTFNVDYLMEDRRLEGNNSIYINQLTLGDTVESPDAVKLPIKLAIALLKDRSGNISLDLPVSGNLDDPQFKIGRVVLTVLKNLIVKIVTSPFAALGAMVGGGEELSYLAFEGGVGEISAENAAKIDKLAKILYERPGLSLDIQGTAGPQWDSDALRATLLENRLKAVKLERMLKAGKNAVPLDEITLDGEERVEIVEATFSESGIAMPLDESGKPVEVTPEEMEKLLRTHIEVSQDDYRQLASARAFNVKQYLLEQGQVDQERIFIVEPTIGPDGPQGMEEARVVFSLK
jgi:uncharacterized protein involved in outer membrane biogenesis